MKKTILELLTAKFPGMRKDGLNNLAMSLSLVCSDEESAKKLVGDLTAEKVEESIKDYRALADAENAKALETYKKSHPEPTTTPQPTTQPTTAPVEQTSLEAITKIVSDTLASTMKPIMDRIGALEGNAVSTSRQSLLENEMTDLPDSFKSVIIDGFKGRKFANDEEFNQYLDVTKGQIASFKKDVKNSGIRTFGNSTKPQQSGGADDVDPIVNAFVEAQKSSHGDFSGKEL